MEETLPQTPPQPPTSSRGTMLYLFLGLLVVVIVAALAMMMRGKTVTKQQVTAAPTTAPKPTLIPFEKKGLVTMTLPGKKEDMIKKGATVKMTVALDTKDAALSGYDILIGYTPSSFAFKSAKSLNSTMQIDAYDNASYVTLTGFLQQAETDKKAVQGKVAELTFEAVKDTKYNFFPILTVENKKRGTTERTRLYDAQNTSYEPAMQVVGTQ